MRGINAPPRGGRLVPSAVLIILAVCAGCFSTGEGRIHPSEVIDGEEFRIFQEAETWFRLGEYDRALELFDQVLAVHPHHFRTLRFRQEIVLAQGGGDAALEATGHSVALRRNSESLTLLARIHKDRETSLDLLEEALVLDKSYVWAHYGIAFILLQEQRVMDYERAMRHLQDALYHSFRFHEARLLLIECLHRLGKYEEAVRQYRAHLELNPEDWDRRYNFADLLRNKLGDLKEALEQLDAILEEDPARLDALLLKGVVLVQAGQYERAEALLQELYYRHPTARLDLALLYKDHLGRPQKALRCLQEYLSYEGEHEDKKSFWDEKVLVPTYIEQLKSETSGGGHP